jgi:hypothetical protein
MMRNQTLPVAPFNIKPKICYHQFYVLDAPCIEEMQKNGTFFFIHLKNVLAESFFLFFCFLE